MVVKYVVRCIIGRRLEENFLNDKIIIRRFLRIIGILYIFRFKIFLFSGFFSWEESSIKNVLFEGYRIYVDDCEYVWNLLIYCFKSCFWSFRRNYKVFRIRVYLFVTNCRGDVEKGFIMWVKVWYDIGIWMYWWYLCSY